MKRKTGVALLIALALSVACLGVFLAARCGRARQGDPRPAAPQVETLTVGSALQSD